jgi:hypothetical protein
MSAKFKKKHIWVTDAAGTDFFKKILKIGEKYKRVPSWMGIPLLFYFLFLRFFSHEIKNVLPVMVLKKISTAKKNHRDEG